MFFLHTYDKALTRLHRLEVENRRILEQIQQQKRQLMLKQGQAAASAT